MPVNQMPTMDNDDEDRQRDADLDDLMDDHHRWQDDGGGPGELPELTHDDHSSPTPVDLDHATHETPDPTDEPGQEFSIPELPVLEKDSHETPDPAETTRPTFGPPDRPEAPTPFAFMPPEQPDLPMAEHETPAPVQGDVREAETPSLPQLPGYPVYFMPPQTDDVGDPRAGELPELPPLQNIKEVEAEQLGPLAMEEHASTDPRHDFEASNFNVPQVEPPGQVQLMQPPNDSLFSQTGWPVQPPRVANTFWYG